MNSAVMHIGDTVTLRPIAHRSTSAAYSTTSTEESGVTPQAYWYRMREQRPYGERLEALRYFVVRYMHDTENRLWRCTHPAVVDDFGNLVEVPA